VTGVAVFVGLANLVGVVAWDVGGLRGLGGWSESSLLEAVPSAVAAVLAALLTSWIVLRKFDLPGRGFWRRYGVVAASVCVGGMIEGAMLGWVFSLDGALFPEAPPGAFAADPLGLAGLLLGAGMVGAVIGLVAGLVEGLVLGLPLATVLGALEGGEHDGRRWAPRLSERRQLSTGVMSKDAAARLVCGSSMAVVHRTSRLFSRKPGRRSPFAGLAVSGTRFGGTVGAT